MKHTLSAVVIGVSMIVSGSIVAVSQTGDSGARSGSGLQELQEAVAESGGEKALTYFRIEKGGTKIISLSHESANALETYTLTSDDEIVVTAITVENGALASGGSNKGAVIIGLDGVGLPNYNIVFDAYENYHYTFPTPLILEEGTPVQVLVPGGNGGGYTQVYLIGRALVSSDKLLIQ